MSRSRSDCRPTWEGNTDQPLPASLLRVTDPRAGAVPRGRHRAPKAISSVIFCLPIFAVYPHLDRMKISAIEIRRAVQAALAEDLGGGDVTSLATVPAVARSRAVMRAREPLVVAGLALAVAAFRQLSRNVKIQVHARDGNPGGGRGIAGGCRARTRPAGGRAVALNFLHTFPAWPPARRNSSRRCAAPRRAFWTPARPRRAGGGWRNTR